ncbi:MAG TPA: DUF3089 domain-containing protein [Candidatus Eisenbergiella pullistercoris]|uniref:DUF3089 domain-containing protein n=1 Tax=Candidatus Eisenbergiella pullistercoris TaxID=2838555 RepID=A0A9D1YUR9_9FIRM|nr:DUF3089 domain-containing protein [Candidatus Eisenbergiella pullistercoris]
MKRQKKHSISYFLLALLLSLSLAAGCSPAGGNAPSAPAAETATAETAAAEGSSAAAAEESAAAEGSAAADTAEAESNTEAEISGAEGDTAAEAAAAEAAPNYSDAANWAYLETENTDKTADVFFICPSVYGGSDDACNMSLSDADTKESFVGAINMEKGIYDADSRFFAPYYRQIGLNVYDMPEADREPYLETAYADVRDAFLYYMDNYNEGRPIVLAGFSQGADMCLRLMKDLFDDEALTDQLVACYAIGWRITEEDMAEYPQLKMAAGESDTGVIVSFNSEAEDITDSLVIPEGTKTFAINPLNWKTDSTPADKSQNLGACFTDYSGEITSEIPELTGAYIDETRGALKVPDVSPEDYPAGLSIFTDGVYHLYDYQFFYRNLQDNVQTRILTFTMK